MADQHEHVWRLSWFGADVQESCACGAYKTMRYDAGPDEDWIVTEPTKPLPEFS